MERLKLINRYKDILTKEFLEKEYIENKKSSVKIADEVGCSPTTIWKYLKLMNISIRPRRKYKYEFSNKLKSFVLAGGTLEEYYWSISTKINSRGCFVSKGAIIISDRRGRRSYFKGWREKNKRRFLESIKKNQAKRKRDLGFTPLNRQFDDSAGHHIDKDYVIYIPTFLHKAIKHNIWTGEGMFEINMNAWDYLKHEKDIFI